MSRWWNKEEKDRAALPQPGDLWTEMLSYWYWVEAVDNDTLTIRHGRGGQSTADMAQVILPWSGFVQRIKHAHFTRNTVEEPWGVTP